MTPKRGVRLLDVDSDLGSLIGADRRDEARRSIVLPVFELPPGRCDIDELARRSTVSGDLLGLLLVDGLLSTTVEIESRACSRMLMAGAILWRGGGMRDTLCTKPAWTAHEPTRVIALDERFLAACARWPRLLAGVIARLAAQDERALRAQAISQLPRVEDRLLGVLWELADQRGRVTSSGISFDIPFTHGMLGDMVGARRPTVSLGFQTLQSRGDLSAAGTGWMLAVDSADRLRPNPSAASRPASTVARAGRTNLVLVLTDLSVLRSRATGPRMEHVLDEASAIAAMAGAPPDVVVIALQRSGGEAVLRHVRRKLPGVPLLLIRPRTGTASAILVEGADAVMEAESDELEILARVQELVLSTDSVTVERKENRE